MWVGVLFLWFEGLGFKVYEGINIYDNNNKFKNVCFEKNRYMCLCGIIV